MGITTNNMAELGAMRQGLMLAWVGMATGQVRARFFHTRTRPVGQDPRPGPGPFTKRVFSRGPNPPQPGPV